MIDWEYAGWYPEHWDYIKFFDRPCKHKDWKNRAGQIFPQVYDNELAFHQAIIRWQYSLATTKAIGILLERRDQLDTVALCAIAMIVKTIVKNKCHYTDWRDRDWMK